MYRIASSRLSSLKARRGNGILTRFSSSTAIATKSPGLFSWLTGEKSSTLPPLGFPLNDVSLSAPLPDYVEPGKTQITTLANGLKVASEASANPVASIGLYVDCGSIYETPASYGATHLLERMAFKSTLNRSHLRIVREVEAIGGNVAAAASREHMIYTYDALKTYVPQMVEMLVDTVRNPAFLDWEVNEQLEKVKAEISEYSKNPQHLLLEAVHSAGYAGPYANSLMATEATINRLNSTVLEEFVAENYTAPRMVLAACGVEHEELLKFAEPLLSDLPKMTITEEPKPVYVGGDYRRQADAEMTHFALAFEVPGGWLSEKEAITLTVLQMLMGGGGSFSAGGPGKGMYSRLYLRVLNQYPEIQAFSAFSSIYNNTGLFGIQATTTSDFGPKAIDVAVKELTAVANPGEVDQVQLDRAKQSTKSAILMNLESRMVASEDIGRQLLTYSEVIDSIMGYLNISSDPATFIQGAIPQILQKTKDNFFSKIVNILREAADICYGRIKDIPCITCPNKPDGSMFAMVKLHLDLLEDIEDDLDFCAKLAKEESLIILPGIVVGLKNWLRITFACEPSLLEDGLQRLHAFYRRHAKKQ